MLIASIAATSALVALLGQPDTAALAREIPRLLRAGDLPGMSIAVIHQGRVAWAGAFGTVNDSARTPLDGRTIFEAASLSKPVFAYVVLRLVDRGEFDLDRPLFEILEYSRLAHDDRYRRITARMVLSHGTGLPNWGGERLTLQFDPGTRYGYSGEGFLFLQRAVERATGLPLDALAQRELFQPLGMTRSSFVWQERFSGNVAHAKDWLWNVAPVNRYAEGNAAYTLLTTAADYGRFVAAMLSGRGLSPRMWKAFLTPVRETSPGISVGLGIRIEDAPEGRTFYHSGSNGRRFTSYMTGDLGSGTGLVYFTNAYNGTSMVEPLASLVFGDEYPLRHRATFDRYDDPRRIVVHSIERAAVEGGAVAARERLRRVGASADTRLTLEETLHVAAFLSGRGHAPLAIELLEAAVAEAPESAPTHLALGKAWESSGDLRSAITWYRRAQSLDSGSGEAQRRLRWVEERLAARARPVAVSEGTLRRYVGRYGERVITMRGGRLHARRGSHPESPLVPMAPDLFEVEREPTYRIRFVGDAGSPARKLIEIYSDGTIEESARPQR